MNELRASVRFFAFGLLALFCVGCRGGGASQSTAAAVDSGDDDAAADAGTTCVPYEGRLAYHDPVPDLSCAEPTLPAAPADGTYTHHGYTIPYPDALKTWRGQNDFAGHYYDQEFAMSANGTRTVFATTLAPHDGLSAFPRYGELYVFSSGADAPLWTYEESTLELPSFGDLTPTFSSVAISGCGRIIALRDTSRVYFFTCDSPTPEVTWDALDDCTLTPEIAPGFKSLGPDLGEMVMSRDGTFVALPARVTVGADQTEYVVILRRDHPKTWQLIKLPVALEPALAFSADGQRLAVLLSGVDAADPTQSSMTGDGVVFLYENGELRFSVSIPNECAACEFPSTFNGDYSVGISADGRVIVAGGPGGRLVSIDAGTGEVQWTYQGTSLFYTAVNPNEYSKVVVSDDGSKVAAVAYQSCHGALYFDETTPGVPRFASTDGFQKPVGIPKETPAPNGFVRTVEPGFGGLFGEGISGCPKIADAWRLTNDIADVEMSGDGRILTVGTDAIDDYRQGYVFAMHAGSPVPFQWFSEPASDAIGPNSHVSYTDSSFIAHGLSHDGAWMSALAFGPAYDTDGNVSYTLRVHTFEVPPGEILEVHNSVTVDINGNTGEILSWFTDNGNVSMDYYVVKPGRAADLSANLHHASAASDAAFDFCIPWETEKDREYNWAAGYQASHESLDWSTPTCVTTLNGINDFVLRSRLSSPGNVLLGQSYASYITVSLSPGH